MIKERVGSLEKDHLDLTEKCTRQRVALKHLLEATQVAKEDIERTKVTAEAARLEIDALKATTDASVLNAAKLEASLEEMRSKYQAQKDMYRRLKNR